MLLKTWDIEGGQPTGERLRDAVFAILGAKVLSYDVRDQVIRTGYAMSNQMDIKKNSTLRDVLTRLDSGEELKHDEIASLVNRMYDDNESAHGYVDYSISSLQDFNVPNHVIKKTFVN